MSFILQKRMLPFFLWLLIITIISGYPGHKVPEVPMWQFDKFVHTFIYLILSITMLIAFNRQYQIRKKRLFLTILILFFGVFYGGIMEILQHYIFINRSGNWYDFIANALGSVLGVLIYPFINKLLPISRWF